MILETAVQGNKVMQDFELESLIIRGEHSQKVKAPPIVSDYGSKDCVNLSPSTAVSRMSQNPNSEIILGVDPGSYVSGYGLISVKDHTLIAVDYGCIRPPIKYKLSERYLIIFEGIDELIEKYKPTVLVVEMQFMYKNAQSALKLGMARSAVMIAAKRKGLPIFEYAPTVAKRAVVGNGKASKAQVQGMVKSLLNLNIIPKPEDAADALALAICHAHAAPHIKAKREV